MLAGAVLLAMEAVLTSFLRGLTVHPMASESVVLLLLDLLDFDGDEHALLLLPPVLLGIFDGGLSPDLFGILEVVAGATEEAAGLGKFEK